MAQDNYGTTKLPSNSGPKEQNGLQVKEKGKFNLTHY